MHVAGLALDAARALARARPRLRATSHIDERCGGFFALGLAKASGRPVALACTSGTAAANYAPAVIEAHEARVPLIVLTADRPPELREVGAGQTIDQVKLYGGAAKWFFEVDDHPATPERLRWMRALACRAFWTALEGRPGPVHLNFSLREPLVLDGPLPEDEPGGGGRAGGRPWVTRPGAPARRAPALLDELAAELERAAARAASSPAARSATRCSARRWPRSPSAAGCPLLAEPLAARAAARPRSPTTTRCCATRAFGAARVPELVLRVGDLPTSKPLRQWLAGLDADDAAGRARPRERLAGPGRRGGDAARRRPARRCSTRSRSGSPRRPRDRGWLEAWRRRTARRRRRSRDARRSDDLSEPRVAAELGARLPAGGDARRRLLDAGPRRRDVLPRPRGPAARAVQPRRERDRRHRVDRVRRRRRRARPGRRC